MGRVIAIANQKGGVGKTTTSINLSAALAEKGKRVLVIDTDPQGNTTSGLGLDKQNLENTIYELMIGECNIDESIHDNVFDNLDIAFCQSVTGLFVFNHSRLGDNRHTKAGSVVFHVWIFIEST